MSGGYQILTVLEGGPCDGQIPQVICQSVPSVYLNPEPAMLYHPNPYYQQLGQDEDGVIVQALYEYDHAEWRDGKLRWVYRHSMSVPLRPDLVYPSALWLDGVTHA